MAAWMAGNIGLHIASERASQIVSKWNSMVIRCRGPGIPSINTHSGDFYPGAGGLPNPLT
jgi:hypothetical protein